VPLPGGYGVALPTSGRLGRFTILQQLGVGGMGSVFAAYDPQLDRKVALKILHRLAGTDRRQRERTLREARALARVTHPHVVSVHEVAETEEQVYLAMEFVDGVTLRHWQSCEPRSWRDVLRMYLLAGEGLWAAHQAGVIHRDFKPDNVLVGRQGIPKVADFGIASLHQSLEDHSLDPDVSLRQESGRDLRFAPEPPEESDLRTSQDSRASLDSRHAGTLGYMSPEQRSGGRLNQASDQWSFCAALHEALYGHLPDAPAEPGARRHGAALKEVQVALPAQSEDIPPELHAILLRGLAQDPGQRFRSMAELLAAMWAEHDQSPGAARRASGFIVVVLSCVAFLLWLGLQYVAARKARIIEYGVGISGLMIVSTLWVGHLHRFSLRVNPFHRWIWILMLANFVQVLGLRLVSTFLVVLPFRIAHSLDMIVWSGTLAILAAQLLRAVRWVLVVPLLSLTVCAMMHSPPRRLLLLSYPLMLGGVLWFWRQASRNPLATPSDTPRRRA